MTITHAMVGNAISRMASYVDQGEKFQPGQRGWFVVERDFPWIADAINDAVGRAHLGSVTVVHDIAEDPYLHPCPPASPHASKFYVEGYSPGPFVKKKTE